MNKKGQFWHLVRAYIFRDWQALHTIAAYYASAHEEGLLPTKYLKKAFRYYEYGAKKGNAACQYDYGFMLLGGDAGPKDKERGLHWIKKAADGGYLAAKQFLADYPQ